MPPARHNAVDALTEVTNFANFTGDGELDEAKVRHHIGVLFDSRQSGYLEWDSTASTVSDRRRVMRGRAETQRRNRNYVASEPKPRR